MSSSIKLRNGEDPIRSRSFVAACVGIGRTCIKKFKKLSSRKQASGIGSKLPSTNYKKFDNRWSFGRMKFHRHSSISASSISCISYLEDSRRTSAVTRPSVQTIATYLEEVQVFQNPYNGTIQERTSDDEF